MRTSLSSDETGLGTSPSVPVLSIVTAAHNEAANLPVLYQRLVEVLAGTGESWEWTVVDDHSSDGTFDVIRAIAAADSHVRGVRLARNSGSHLAMTCGLEASRGQCAVILAADLQDPPETVVPLLEKWRAGAQVIWAVCPQRQEHTGSTVLFARLYYWMMRRVVGLRNMPANGADFLLMDRRVLDALRRCQEPNISLYALITWMGFRQDHVVYVKPPRLHGSSSWGLGKKVELVVDSITAFSYLPVRIMWFSGLCLTLAALLCLSLLIVRYFTGSPVAGWTWLIVIVLVMSGVQLLSMAVLGEYIGKAVDAVRGRPRFLIEDATSPLAAESGKPQPPASV